MIEAKETIVGEISSNQNLRGELLPRGPKGDKGEKGDKGDKGDTGAKGADGKDGAIQYEAGENITIEGNVISATGGGGGGINIAYTIDVQGTNSNPTIIDRTKLKIGDYILVNAENTIFKFTDTIDGVGFLYNGLYQISKIPNSPSSDNPCIMSSLPIYLQNSGDVNSCILEIYNYKYMSTKELKILSDGSKYVDTKSFQNVYGWKIFRDRIDVPTPSSNNNATNKKYVDTLPTTYAGYDATKTQVLKNMNGTLTWVDE